MPKKDEGQDSKGLIYIHPAVTLLQSVFITLQLCGHSMDNTYDLHDRGQLNFSLHDLPYFISRDGKVM